MPHARFITLDGIDGAGKSTNLAVIRNWFEQRQMPVVFTREPGGTPLGEALRRLLLDPATRADLRSDTLLMFAARNQHLSEVIRPALASGIHVVSDRFTDATFAYQGGGRGLPAEAIAELEQWVQNGLQPDLTFLLDIPLSVSQERLAAGRDKDRFEQEDAAFFERVRQSYLDRAAAAPERYVRLDSTRDKTLVKADIEQALNRHFGLDG